MCLHIVSPYTQHINIQLRKNIINILCFNIDFKLYLKYNMKYLQIKLLLHHM